MAEIRPILLIEDNPMDIDLTRRAFQHQKLSNPLIVLRDGAEAIAHVDGLHSAGSLPVVILLDLKLPKVNGLDVLKNLKAHKDYVKVPVVVLATSKDNNDIERAYSLGAASYIIKPVDIKKFFDVAETIQLYWLAVNTPPFYNSDNNKMNAVKLR